MKYYTVGQISRLGLLKNRKGIAYKDKANILRIVQGMEYSKIRTPHGMGYKVSELEIDKWNKKHINNN